MRVDSRLCAALMLAGLSLLAGCQGSPEQMSRIATYDGGEAQLRQLYAQHQAPLVVIGTGIYLPPPGCLCQRETAAAVQTRQTGGEVQQRATAGQTQNRQESGGTQQRSTAGETQAHTTVGEAEGRGTGGATQSHAITGEAEQRVRAGGAEQRVMAGGAEQRVIGGASIPIKCVRRGDCKGFEVQIPAGGGVQYFDGQSLKDAPDRFVPMR